MKVYVSVTAKISLQEIIIFLKLHWTQKEIATLKNDIKKFVRTVNEGILKHQSAEDFLQSKFALIGNK